jgi:hypothetical protein
MEYDNHVVVGHKLYGFQGCVAWHIAVMKEQCGACSIKIPWQTP